MKILVDLLHIRKCSYAGIYIAAIDIVKGLKKYSDFELILLIWEDQVEYIDNWIGESIGNIKVPIDQKDYLDKMYTIHIPPKWLVKDILKEQVDCVFTTCYTINSYIFPKKLRQVGIVYDMQPFRISMAEGRRKYALYWLILSIIYYRKLSNIITISKSTTKEVKKFSGRNSTPIYLNIESSLKAIDGTVIPEIANTRYILDVNSFMKYKNTENLIYAFAEIKDKIPHKLYLKGYCNDNDKQRCQDLKRLVESLGITGRVVIDTSNRSNSEMSYLFANAELFVSPSLLEGFGLTPLEAACHRCPIAVSDIETLVEVTDGKIPTFNPHSVKSIADTMLRVLENPPTSEEKDFLACHYKNRYSLERQSKEYVSYFYKLFNKKFKL